MGNFNSTSTLSNTTTLPFDPQEFPRETSRHYISATEQEIKDMLSTIGLTELSQLFAHINPTFTFSPTTRSS
jgi:glycine cleavage system pyridoxal-binding protein P